MADAAIQIEVSFKWWVVPYVHAAKLFCMTFGTEPDFDRIIGFIVRYGVHYRFPQRRRRA